MILNCKKSTLTLAQLQRELITSKLIISKILNINSMNNEHE